MSEKVIVMREDIKSLGDIMSCFPNKVNLKTLCADCVESNKILARLKVSPGFKLKENVHISIDFLKLIGNGKNEALEMEWKSPNIIDISSSSTYYSLPGVVEEPSEREFDRIEAVRRCGTYKFDWKNMIEVANLVYDSWLTPFSFNLPRGMNMYSAVAFTVNNGILSASVVNERGIVGWTIGNTSIKSNFTTCVSLHKLMRIKDIIKDVATVDLGENAPLKLTWEYGCWTVEYTLAPLE